MSADRGAYIDQSQSLNIHIAEPTFGKMSSMHFYAWRKGLKTGLYYLRTRPAADPIKFTVDKSKLKITKDAKIAADNKIADKENMAAIDVLKTNQALINGKINNESKRVLPDSYMSLKKEPVEPVKTEEKTDENLTATELTSNDDLLEQLKMACSLKNKEACMMCSS